MFTLTSTAVLFSILSSFVEAAPLPMPAVKQSEQLASRFYNHPDTLFSHQNPCWQNGLQGVLRDDVCVLAALDIENDRYVPGPGYRPTYIHNQGQGQPCTLNGQPGFWQDAVCVLANLDVNLKKKDSIPYSYQRGQECWLNGRRGYFTNDGLCDLIDLHLIAEVNDGPTFLNNGLPTATPFSNDPCWVNGQQGFWENDLCVLADLNIAKRYTTSGGLVSDVLETLTGYEDCYNCGPGYPTRHAVLPTDTFVDAEALVDVDNLNKRNGLLHKAPDGNKLDGAVRTVTQLLDHSVTKRGLNILGGEDKTRYPYYPNGYVQPEFVPVLDNTLAEIDAQVNVDDEPYYGSNHPHYLNGKQGGLLGLKRDILGNGDNNLNVLSSLGSVLDSPHHHSTRPGYYQASNGQIVPFGETSDILAEVDAAVNIDGPERKPHRYAPYTYAKDGRRIYGEFIPSHGLLSKKNLGGLSGVDGLGLNRDGSFPEGLDVVPQLDDLLGAGKGDDVLGGLGKGTNGLNHIL
ncbi:hypothetical protein I302_101722 [Kwoniella bestiolae CBS 10118]|uniref:Uncharacterized protein n=1 Tax=Kwoniella bestiolae CBS 10118 TaxID=1296100 RepID=A0A1B9GD12_9TREE|nr:hypothetical protein I302_00398 [Kwoniella bestiolae CBS 10118]OCF28908.1 hypothetical protein I302_00398 [Kwoniella bestiolae CBS 10118]